MSMKYAQAHLEIRREDASSDEYAVAPAGAAPLSPRCMPKARLRDASPKETSFRFETP